MARTLRLLALTGLACGALALSGCQADQARAPGPAAEAPLAADLEGFREEMRRRLQEVEREIDAFDERGQQAPAPRQAEYASRTVDLRDDLLDIREQLEDEAAHTDADPERYRDGIRSDIRELERRTHRARLDLARTPEEFRSFARLRLDRITRDAERFDDEAWRATFEERREAVRVRLDSLGVTPGEAPLSVRTEIAEGLDDLRRRVNEAADLDRPAPLP